MVDVYKETAVATVGGKGVKEETKTYETFTSSSKEMKDWLMSIDFTDCNIQIKRLLKRLDKTGCISLK